ncbi:hypothetical protein ANN_10620 [Periplaneta americana]|uniref:Uncharacterized protein n=1 Tax=Periplaneta americana TaxID=6978 RepID=A0ABQ8T2T9_PERAM|nr:hypothetical protein ANN_10620 [Periplaneta americana]
MFAARRTAERKLRGISTSVSKEEVEQNGARLKSSLRKLCAVLHNRQEYGTYFRYKSWNKTGKLMRRNNTRGGKQLLCESVRICLFSAQNQYAVCNKRSSHKIMYDTRACVTSRYHGNQGLYENGNPNIFTSTVLSLLVHPFTLRRNLISAACNLLLSRSLIIHDSLPYVNTGKILLWKDVRIRFFKFYQLKYAVPILQSVKRTAIAELMVHRRRSKKLDANINKISELSLKGNNVCGLTFDFMQNLPLPNIPV